MVLDKLEPLAARPQPVPAPKPIGERSHVLRRNEMAATKGMKPAPISDLDLYRAANLLIQAARRRCGACRGPPCR